MKKRDGFSILKGQSSLKGALYEIENYTKYYNYFNNRCNVIIVHILNSVYIFNYLKNFSNKRDSVYIIKSFKNFE